MTRHDELRAIFDGAAAWRLLGLLSSRPRPGWLEEVRALAAEVDDPELRRAAEAAGEASEGAYHALLGAGGIASPREAAHLGFGDPGRLLADLSARYAAFGFAPRAEDPDDHLAVECDFVSYLFLKEAFARSAGSEEAAEVTREARARFVHEHAAVTGRGMIARLPDGAPRYLLLAAAALAARLPEVPEVTGTVPDDDPCGDCPGSACPRPE